MGSWSAAGRCIATMEVPSSATPPRSTQVSSLPRMQAAILGAWHGHGQEHEASALHAVVPFLFDWWVDIAAYYHHLRSAATRVEQRQKSETQRETLVEWSEHCALARVISKSCRRVERLRGARFRRAVFGAWAHAASHRVCLRQRVAVFRRRRDHMLLRRIVNTWGEAVSDIKDLIACESAHPTLPRTPHAPRAPGA